MRPQPEAEGPEDFAQTLGNRKFCAITYATRAGPGFFAVKTERPMGVLK